MAKRWQIRRGNTADNSTFLGAEGELSMDTQTKAVRVHDGVTVGGCLIDTVVAFQAPTAENNYTWYRLYASGWVEQGGLAVYDSNPKTITFPVTMADANYTGMAIQQRNADLGAVWAQINTKATTGFVVGGYYANGSVGNADSSRNFNWEVKGMAAS